MISVSMENTVFFGKDYASVYDACMHQIPYNSWADYTEDVLTHFGIKGRSILDLACGTGSLAIILARRGFFVTAIDCSSHMLKQLKRKLLTLELKNKIDIVNSRLSNFEVPLRYDCATCYFDSINYIIDSAELAKTFRTISKHLNAGGLFIFDINTVSGYRNGILARKGKCQLNSSTISYNFGGNFDPCSRIAKMQLRFCIKAHVTERNFHEVHLQRAYEYNEIEECLNKTWLKVIGFFKAFSFFPASATDERWTFVTQKK